jgi:hypothetical protein
MGDNPLALRRTTEAISGSRSNGPRRKIWNPARHDARWFYAADPHGFLLAGFAGRPIGSVSAVRYGSCFGFLGLHIVKAEFRGRGFGLELWRAALGCLGEGIVGLDGVVVQQENYRKRVSRSRSAASAVRRRRGSAPGLIDLKGVALDEIARYDRPRFRRRGWSSLRRGLGSRRPTRSRLWADGA